jgi:methionine-rich copper-binding protein CopC
VRRRLAVAGLAIGLALVAGPAQAHNYLVASTPAAGSTMTELPEAFSITTNDALLDLSADNAGFALQVQDAAGLYYGDGCLTVSGTTMSAVPALGEPGQYTLTWQLVSADGHTVSDRFPFGWQPAGEFEATTGSASAPVCGAAAPSASASATAGPEPVAPEPAADDGTLTTLLWIGGAVLVVVIAVVVTVLVLGRRKPE